jgi:poly-gamma-glutamate capsule biosynthesis protein CapA/YwtB (metallophosphatase superfamily)
MKYTLLLLLGITFNLQVQGQIFTEKLKLVFAGDIMGHSTQIKAALLPDGTYDYHHCFKYVAPILKQADLAIGNLEFTLPGKPPYSGYPQFRSPDAVAVALKEAGFDMLVTANNHSNDAGRTGVENTIRILRNLGFHQTGTFLDSMDRSLNYPLFIQHGNFKLAFLNYTYGTNGIPTKFPVIVNQLDEKQMAADMEKARGSNPDAIIVMVHWGNEYQLVETSYQRQLAQKLFLWGAKLVIGSHPHVVQSIEQMSQIDSLRKGELTVVAYSLGNFISGQIKTYTDIGAMVEVELEKELPFGSTCITRTQYIPVFRYVHRAPTSVKYYTLPATLFSELNQRDPFPIPTYLKEKLKQDLKTIRPILSKHGIPEKPVFPNLILPPIMKMETQKIN